MRYPERHAITHGYEGVDHEEMWQTIWRDIPDLGRSLSEPVPEHRNSVSLETLRGLSFRFQFLA